jgi:hypothetical protein
MKDARARAVIDAAANGWLGTKDTGIAFTAATHLRR